MSAGSEGPSGSISRVPPSLHCPPGPHGQDARGLGPVLAPGTYPRAGAALPRPTSPPPWT